MSEKSLDRNPVDQLAEEFVERHRRGEHPTIAEYVERHPDLENEIRELFPTLVALEQFKPGTGDQTGPFGSLPAASGLPPPRAIGEYRILREIGRGGMGVVYEAIQESLGRHVALKVLPASGLPGPTHLERFRREARAAGRLHHTNIVPVFGTGTADGLHFYAMQFIAGQSLDRILRDLRNLREPKTGSPAADPTVARSLLTGRFPETMVPTDGERQENLPPTSPPPASDPVPSATSALSASSNAQFYRSVARIGLQVAEALTYAHRQGVLHRDIKPSNLLLDPQGTTWVTDFGLAKADDGDELTGTGDVIGTLRYMAPERFDGVSLPQGDVYSLGLTLYEMLTLRPPFEDANRARLVEKVLHETPTAPRQIDPGIPADLETILLKAMARDPRERYSTAEELAEDLRRFRADLPVKARRLGWVERTWRWCKRNPAVAALTAVLVLLLAGIAIGSSVFAFHFKQQRDDARRAAERAKEAEERAQAFYEAMFNSNVLPDPVHLMAFKGKIGQSYFIAVKGEVRPPVWGTDIYTLDSRLAAAAVHAGILKNGQKGIVKVTILPARDSYEGSRRHDVVSERWGEFEHGSFRVEGADHLARWLRLPEGGTQSPLAELTSSPEKPLPDPGTMVPFRGLNGKSYYFEVTGFTLAPVYGDKIYTDDSYISVAAVHAGLLKNMETGVVKVTILEGRDSYPGVLANGIQTMAWNEPWPGSYSIERVR